jgi:hypothetical protein
MFCSRKTVELGWHVASYREFAVSQNRALSGNRPRSEPKYFDAVEAIHVREL